MFSVSLQIFIDKNKDTFLSPQRIALLRAIRQYGSLNAAARALKISYQSAWMMIQEINFASPKPLVIKQRGGASGGGAILSDYGDLLLSEYQLIEEQVRVFEQRLNTEISL